MNWRSGTRKVVRRIHGRHTHRGWWSRRSRVYGNVFANNLTTTANVEATYLKGDGSELTHVTLDQVVGYANTTANTILLTNADVGLKATGKCRGKLFRRGWFKIHWSRDGPYEDVD
jgi:hypothetical protein